jgi:Tfp pilus assembly protein PilF
MDRTAEADWQFRIARAISPLSTRAHNAYGEFLYSSERLEEARDEFERSVQVDPTLDAYDRLGDIYVTLQDRKKAETAFRGALTVNNFDSHAHFALGQLLEEDGRPGDALREIESGLQTDPNDSAAKMALVRLRGNSPDPAIPR